MMLVWVITSPRDGSIDSWGDTPTFRWNNHRAPCFTTGVTLTSDNPEEGSDMSSVTSSWRQRRQAARTRRALALAVARTSSPAMRDELLTLANSSQFTNALR
jgi:hypothetical protein